MLLPNSKTRLKIRDYNVEVFLVVVGLVGNKGYGNGVESYSKKTIEMRRDGMWENNYEGKKKIVTKILLNWFMKDGK